MGVQLSTNYANIQQTCQYDFWNIHSAQHKTTNESVSLWIIDNERFGKKYTARNERDQYFDLCLTSIQNIRKLRHPRILKILEVNEKKPDIAFASEPVTSCVESQIKKMHAMDAAYISLQIAEVLGFLNQDARLAHLGLSPAAVMLNGEMSVKLIHFQWSAPISAEGLVSFPDKLLSSRVMTEYQYKPPEILAKKEVTSTADIFIFGLFMFNAFTGESLNQAETPQDILNAYPTRLCSIYNVPNDFKQLIQACLSIEPSVRPSFLQILQNQAFQSMQLKSMRYIDMILTKEPGDKFKFYKGLATKIEDFSPSLARIKILPVFMNECKADVRFAPILLGPILTISKNFSPAEFMSVIWSKLTFLTTIVNPVEVSISLLKHLKMILEKVEIPLHKDFVYPIVFSALAAPDPRIHRECLANISHVIEEMNENGIRTAILPRILDLATNSSDSQIAASAVLCVKQCLPKIDNDSFATEMLPRLATIWQKAKNATVALSIVQTIEALNASNDIMMSKAISIAAEIAGSHAVEGDVKMRLCDWMINTIRSFKEQRPPKNFSVTEASSNADNPFGQSAQSTAASMTMPTPAAVKSETTNSNANSFGAIAAGQSQINASDIFGTSSSSNLAAASKPAAQVNQTNVFGSSTQPKLDASDIFGSSIASTEVSNTMNTSDIFGTSSNVNNSSSQQPRQPYKPQQTAPSSSLNTADIFGSPQAPPVSKPAPQINNVAMDIFGPSTTQTSSSRPPQQFSSGGSANVYQQSTGDIDIFGSSRPSQNYGTNNNNTGGQIFDIGKPQAGYGQNNYGGNQGQSNTMNNYGMGQNQTNNFGMNQSQPSYGGGMNQAQPSYGSGVNQNQPSYGGGMNQGVNWTGNNQNVFGNQPTNMYNQPTQNQNQYNQSQRPNQGRPGQNNDFLDIF